MSFWKEVAGAPPPSQLDYPEPSSKERSLGGEKVASGSQRAGAVEADLILLHPPSIYDFRERDDIFHANLSTSDCGVTPVYEMYPLGFKSIERFLGSRGHSVRIINIASLLLRYPTLQVPSFLSSLSARAFGIDLHWMVHVQGSLALAEEVKRIHPDTPVIFGGISSTYYADELILYPQIDMVLKGYDTLEPLGLLMENLKSTHPDLSSVPNLCYKDFNRKVHKNDFDYLPQSIPGIDWSEYGNTRATPTETKKLTGSPYVFVLTSTGCAHNCPWCGGSRDSYKRIMGLQGRTVMYKPLEEMLQEVRSLGNVSNTGMFIYALQWYCEPRERMVPLVKAASEVGIRKIQFELFYLLQKETLEEICKYVKPTFNLSPQSHDQEISRLAGRGTFTMEEMEDWIEQALPIGVDTINVWFFIGMPKQTPQSVFDTVEYCRHLLARFKGKNVIPLICPMIPFLDPGSNFFVEPEKHGYRIFHRSVEEHRAAVLTLRLQDRLNYETLWMNRDQIVYTSYEAVKRLVKAKGEIGMLPRTLAESVIARIDEAVEMMHGIDDLTSPGTVEMHEGELSRLKEKVREYNRRLLSSRSDQVFPVERSLDSRWFDEFEYNPEVQ